VQIHCGALAHSSVGRAACGFGGQPAVWLANGCERSFGCAVDSSASLKRLLLLERAVWSRAARGSNGAGRCGVYCK
jgi:hypothetical protein